MTNAVKERVARAIYGAYAGDPDDCDADELSRVSMDVARDDAHAAISALRPGDEIDLGEFGTVVLAPKEPTTAMEDAFHNAMEVDFEVQRQRCLKEGIAWKSLFYIVWRAAIAAAKETTR